MVLRINKFIAQSLNISRRKAEELISSGQIKLNDELATLTDRIDDSDQVFYANKKLENNNTETILIKLNKPVGYVCTHSAQGRDPSIFKLLPRKYAKLKIIGRLDKNTSGLVLLTNNGDLAHQLMHPSFNKVKTYQVRLSSELSKSELSLIQTDGVDIGDERPSKLKLKRLNSKFYEVVLEEGRNRQIRRTFRALGNEVVNLKRLSLDEFELGELEEGEWIKY